MIVYGILNNIDYKLYVGKSEKDNDIDGVRPRRHFGGRGSKLVFQAVQKYGKENFTVLLLHKESCTREKLSDLEKYYIKHFNTISPNGYNITEGGDGGSGKGRKDSIATKNKKSVAAKLANTPEVRKKKSLAKIGTRLSVEHKKNVVLNHADCKGENNPSVKLTWVKVNEIRNLYSTKNYSYTQLAKIFDVGTSTIHRIITNTHWRVYKPIC